MRILIVGASGQIGGHLRAQWAAEGHTVVGTYASVAQPGLVALDLEDEVALAAAVRDVQPEVVVLAAGWTWVDGNEDDPERSQRLNCERPLALMRATRAAGALFVTYSTDYVFDGRGGPYREDDATAPLNAYGRAKLALEEALAREEGEHLVLRTSTVYGPETQGKNFVYQLVRRLRAGEPFRVPSDQVATPSYGPDVARATRALVEQGARGLWHATGPSVLSRAGFAREACHAWGLSFASVEVRPTAELGQRAERPLKAALDSRKLVEAGIRLRGVRAGLAAMRAAIASGGYAEL